MEYLNVIAAAAAAWVFGAIWYTVLGAQWMAAAGLTEETIDRKDPVPYLMALVCAIIVAGMMRLIFQWSGVDGTGSGFKIGMGLGLFIAAPWLTTNYIFAQRPRALIVIDALYATLGSAVIGTMLELF